MRTMTFPEGFSACRAPPFRPRAPLATVHVVSSTTEALFGAVSSAAAVVYAALVGGRFVVGDIVVSWLTRLALASDRFAGRVRPPPPLRCCCHSRSWLMLMPERCDRVVVFSAAAGVWLAVHSNLSCRRRRELEFESRGRAAAVHGRSRSSRE